MSIVGRRRSGETGWSWSSGPPSGPRPASGGPPLLPLFGAGLLALLVALIVLAASLCGSESEGSPPAAASPTAMPTPAETPATPTPAVTPTPSPTVAPSPTAAAVDLQLGIWDGRSWQFEEATVTNANGRGVPALLRLGGLEAGATYHPTVRYRCRTFEFLTSYSRDSGTAPALAAGGPGSAVPDGVLQVPDDPDTEADDGDVGALSVWGGAFEGLTPIEPPGPCAGEKALSFALKAEATTVYLMWGAVVSPDAGGPRTAPISVAIPETGEASIDIAFAAVLSAP